MIVLLFTVHLNEKQDGRYVIHDMAKLYCPGHAKVKGNDRADRLVEKAIITSSLRLGRPGLQSQGHDTIHRLQNGGIETGSAR